MSSATYSIYANGFKTDATTDAVTDGDLRAVTSNAVYNVTKNAIYTASGVLLNSTRGEIEGSGFCFGVLSNGLAKIDFTITILANSIISDDNFNYGLNSDYLFQKGWPRVTPINGGRICIISPQKTLSDYNGYGAMTIVNNQFWAPTRVYEASGTIGQWPSNVLAQGTTITGVVYGTY